MQQPIDRCAPQRAGGKGRLVTKLSCGRPWLAKSCREGSARIRLPILINTSGGLTGGDVIKWSVAASDSTRVVTTTRVLDGVATSSSINRYVNRLGD